LNLITTKRPSPSREKIIAEAVSLAAAEGWKKVTVRAIASRLNYKPPVLYQFFDNKDHLIRTILESGFQTLKDLMEEAENRSDDPEEKLVNIALARFRFAKDHAALHSLMFTTDSPKWFRETVLTGMCQTRDIVSNLLKEISGRTDDCLDLITNFISIIKGYSFFATELPSEHSQKQFFGEKNPEEELRKAMIRFLKSIRSK